MDKQNLRKMLKEKLEEKKIDRSNNASKEKILAKSLQEVGLDITKFKEDLEAVKKSGLTMKLNQ